MADSPQDIQRKLAYYQRKYELNPRSRMFAPLADLLRRSGRLQEALDLVQSGLLDHPRYVSALVILGRCQTDAGSWAAAKDAFLRVMEIDPDNLVALKYLAEDALRQQDWEEASGLLKRVIMLDPGDNQAEEDLARVKEQLVSPPTLETTPESDRGTELEADLEPELATDDGTELEAFLEPELATDDGTELEADLEPELATDDGTELDAFLEPELATDDGTEPATDLEPELAPETVISPEDQVSLDQAAPAYDVYTTPQLQELAPEPLPEETTAKEPATAQGDDLPPDSRFPATKTLADIYLSQGYRDKALTVLRQILARHPQREDIREQIARIESSPYEAPGSAAPENQAPARSRPVDDEIRRKYFEDWLTSVSRRLEE